MSETPKIHVKLQKGLKVAVYYGKMYIRHKGGCADFCTTCTTAARLDHHIQNHVQAAQMQMQAPPELL